MSLARIQQVMRRSMRRQTDRQTGRCRVPGSVSMPESHISISNTSYLLKRFLETSSDWSCKVNNKGKLRPARVFTHPPCADCNKVTPQNLHRAKRARTLSGLDLAPRTRSMPLLMEQTDTEPKLCLIVSTNCSWFTDTCCSAQSHTQPLLCQALCVRDEQVQSPRSGLNWGTNSHDLLTLSPAGCRGYIFCGHRSGAASPRWLGVEACLTETSADIWGSSRKVKVKGHCYITPSEH